MSLPPYEPIGNVRLIPGFFRQLKDDLVFLCQADIKIDRPVAPHHDEAQARRLIKFAAVRQAVRKQEIRESLHYRFGQCFSILGVITFPVTLLGIFIWCYCYVSGVVFKLFALSYFLFH